MSEKMEMRRVWDFNDADVLSLVAKSDEYLSTLCGAVKLFEDDTTYGEIKRVSVEEEQRGKRLAIDRSLILYRFRIIPPTIDIVSR